MNSKQNSAPLVSVVILYYKRRETINEAVDSVVCQDDPNFELIVVDNHSEDDLKQLLAKYGDRLGLTELKANLGACAGRNVGIRAARGEFIVFLDDDMKLLSPFELARMRRVFEMHSGIHALAFQVCDPDTGKLRLREWCHPRHWKEHSEAEFETHWFCEGAAAFRREVFENCGGYYEPLFFGAEGGDLVVRILNRGYRILHAPQVRVGHRAAETGRSSFRQYYYYTRNYVWTACKDFPFFAGMRFLIPKILMMSYFALRTGNFRAFFRGVTDGLKGLRRVRRDRTPATSATLHYLAELEKWRPNLFVRLARHRTAPQI